MKPIQALTYSLYVVTLFVSAAVILKTMNTVELFEEAVNTVDQAIMQLNLDIVEQQQRITELEEKIRELTDEASQ